MQKLVIDAGKKGTQLNLKELFQYKDLLFTLVQRDFKVKYAQTFLGFLWAFIQPLFTLMIFTFIFGKAVKVNTGNIPYPLFVLSGLVAWTYFATVMAQAGNSIIGAQGMVKKIYFPRLVIPLSKAFVGLIDLGITFLFLIFLMVYHKYLPPSQIVLFPVFLLILIISSLAVGIFLSALIIRYRDFQHVIPFMVQIGLYATPVAYPASLIPDNYQWLFFLNPMAGIVEGFRWCLLGGNAPGRYIYISFFIILVLFVISLFYFKKVEKVMADIV